MRKNKKNEELQSRREFFKKAAKGALPILGVLTFGPSVLTSCKKDEDDCIISCSSSCQDEAAINELIENITSCKNSCSYNASASGSGSSGSGSSGGGGNNDDDDDDGGGCKSCGSTCSKTCMTECRYNAAYDTCSAGCKGKCMSTCSGTCMGSSDVGW